MINIFKKQIKQKRIFQAIIFIMIIVMFFVNAELVIAASVGDVASAGGDIVLGAIGSTLVLVLGIIAYILTAVIGMLITVVVYLLIQVAQFNNIINVETVVKGWVIVRDLCNMSFILILLIIAFATILRQENFSAKKLLPKLLIMAILINFSRTIFGLLIDFSQVIMLTFVNAFAAGGGWFINAFRIDLLLSIKEVNSTGDFAVTSWSTAIAIIAGVLAAIITLIVVSVILAVLVARIIMLWIYTIFSPLVFLGFAFPPLQKYTGKIWEDFTKQLVVGPVLAFFIWLALTTASGSSSTMSAGLALDSTNQVCVGVGAFFCTGNFQNFIIVIGLLMGGLMVAQSMGGAAGAIAGKGLDWAKKVAGSPGALALKGGNRLSKLVERKFEENGMPIFNRGWWQGLGTRGDILNKRAQTRATGKGAQVAEDYLHPKVIGLSKKTGLRLRKKEGALDVNEVYEQQVLNEIISEHRKSLGPAADSRQAMQDLMRRGFEDKTVNGHYMRMAAMQQATSQGNLDDAFFSMMPYFWKKIQNGEMTKEKFEKDFGLSADQGMMMLNLKEDREKVARKEMTDDDFKAKHGISVEASRVPTSEMQRDWAILDSLKTDQEMSSEDFKNKYQKTKAEVIAETGAGDISSEAEFEKKYKMKVDESKAVLDQSTIRAEWRKVDAATLEKKEFIQKYGIKDEDYDKEEKMTPEKFKEIYSMDVDESKKKQKNSAVYSANKVRRFEAGYLGLDQKWVKMAEMDENIENMDEGEEKNRRMEAWNSKSRREIVDAIKNSSQREQQLLRAMATSSEVAKEVGHWEQFNTTKDPETGLYYIMPELDRENEIIGEIRKRPTREVLAKTATHTARVTAFNTAEQDWSRSGVWDLQEGPEKRFWQKVYGGEHVRDIHTAQLRAALHNVGQYFTKTGNPITTDEDARSRGFANLDELKKSMDEFRNSNKVIFDGFYKWMFRGRGDSPDPVYGDAGWKPSSALTESELSDREKKMKKLEINIKLNILQDKLRQEGVNLSDRQLVEIRNYMVDPKYVNAFFEPKDVPKTEVESRKADTGDMTIDDHKVRQGIVKDAEKELGDSLYTYLKGKLRKEGKADEKTADAAAQRLLEIKEEIKNL
ncbi:MAG: hypothetical protein PHS62_03765 [Patescibacteria group bacterium]|nr:hypothetical protein [Patescibacteria group bacterium]